MLERQAAELEQIAQQFAASMKRASEGYEPPPPTLADVASKAFAAAGTAALALGAKFAAGKKKAE